MHPSPERRVICVHAWEYIEGSHVAKVSINIEAVSFFKKLFITHMTEVWHLLIDPLHLLLHRVLL